MIDIDKITLFLNLNLMYYFDICFKKKKKKPVKFCEILFYRSSSIQVDREKE